MNVSVVQRCAVLAMACGGSVLCAGMAMAADSAIETNSKLPPVTQLLQQDYEVKTGFTDPIGTAYLVMQKATSAYLCHSGAVPACDKLN